MRLLHTSDWHLGKVLKGVSRLEEQRAVMAEVAGIARDQEVDVVLVAGDVFESAVPPADAQALAWETLLSFRSTGAEVVVIAGNHDNAHAFDAVRPVFHAIGITLLGSARRPDDGGVITLERGGQRAVLAAMPFCSQRGIVRAEQLMNQTAAEQSGEYAARLARMIKALCAGFTADTANLIVAHAMVRGGRLGGGERDAQTIEEYWIDASAFPTSAQYVALGHLHRPQELPGGTRVRYSGSPFHVDFGEEQDQKSVTIVDVRAGAPAVVNEIALTTPRRLRTLTGTLEDLRAQAVTVGDDLLRVLVDEPQRVGLADEVRELLPNALEVRLLRQADDETGGAIARPSRAGRSPHELFGEFLSERGIEDERLVKMFSRLLDEETART